MERERERERVDSTAVVSERGKGEEKIEEGGWRGRPCVACL